MGDAPSRRQARTVARLSNGVTQSLIETATDANAAYTDAVSRGAPRAELQALAAAGLEAAERLHSNIETILEATVQARTSRWRSREKVEAHVHATLGPRLVATGQAVQDWRDRVWRHATPAPSPTEQPRRVMSPPRAVPEDGTTRHVALLADGSGVTFESQAGQWVWRFDPGVPDTVTTTALAMAELQKLQAEGAADDDAQGFAGPEE